MNLTTKTMIATASILLALSSASGIPAEAAAAKPQSKTKATPGKNNLELQKKEAMAIHSSPKNPGDLTVMYDGTDNTLSYNFLSINSAKYEDYLNLLSDHKAPELKQPAWLPEGYVFQSGEISPPYFHFLSQAYQDMLEKLKTEAKGKKYVAKKLNWSEAGEAAIVFAKEKDIIRISAKRVQPLITEITRVPGKGEKFEKLSLDGIQAIFSTGSNAVYSTKLTWEDTENQLEYEIATYRKSPLTKEDLVAIAESILQE
ncbi:hypothetical protein [Paenibacillus woosongensis]|uniref:DUF4367 domain-containing protein n=1 Tax=Paenibacillus woosongensis TaxID=307580 RepID=A0ABQ4MLE2_9BACL|nr:hypothetical protein [Paenibacillus woosongensis]GIP56788.1 hypothetical protein J15TS10_06020 [Paenibacillus woosongensis]